VTYKICYGEIPLKIHIKDGYKITKVEFIKHCDTKNSEVLEEFLKLVKGLPGKFSIDLSDTDEKSLKVFKATLTIPYGKVTTYGEISKKAFGNINFSRFVGYALSRNPLPVIIPCHRVVDRSFRLRGFTGGLLLKEHLLISEGVKIKDGKVDRRFFVNL